MLELAPEAAGGRLGARKMPARMPLAALLAGTIGWAFAGRTTPPPGAAFPKVASVALAHPEETRVGGQFASAAREHGGSSGFRIISVGIDGFLARGQMIDAAERTLDLQYFIFRGDETGRLLTDAHAAPPLIAQTEVNYLLGFVGSSGCDFYRNGSWYDSTAAQGHLRDKYEWLVQHDQVKTTEDFIEKAATKSSLSGRPYKIRCNGGPVESTNQWLRVALARYRSPAAH